MIHVPPVTCCSKQAQCSSVVDGAQYANGGPAVRAMGSCCMDCFPAGLLDVGSNTDAPEGLPPRLMTVVTGEGLWC